MPATGLEELNQVMKSSNKKEEGIQHT